MGALGKAIYTVGFWIRETGQAMDRLGCRLQGNYYFHEQLSRHRTLRNIFDKAPNIDRDAFVAPSASAIGDVQVGPGSSIWYGSVLRGDVNNIKIWAGNPAKFLRNLTEEVIAYISQSAVNYVNLAQVHAAENAKSYDEIEFEKVLRKKFARRDEEYDSMLGVVREVPPELILPDNILPKSLKPAQ